MSSGSIRRGRRTTIVVLAAWILLILGAVPALAHSSLERSDPSHGGKVEVGTTALTLWFSEPISPQASIFGLQTSDGVDQAIAVVVSEADGGGVVEVQTDPLAKAIYTLEWAVLSLEDGHIERGSVIFGAGITPDVALSQVDGLPEGSELLLRWLDLALLMLVIGAIAVSGRVLGSITTAKSAVLDHARHIGVTAAGAAIVVGALTPFFRVPRGDSSVGTWLDATLATLGGTPWGQLWMAREVGLVVLAVALWLRATHRSESHRLVWIAAGAVAVVAGLESWAGHASALPRQSAFAAVASAAHLGAAGVWAGGIIVLALCLFPVMRRDPDARGPMLATAWRRFSPMAALATVVLVATGLYESGRHIPDLAAVSSTVYGGGVAAKVTLACLALLLAGLNTLLINPRLAAPVGRLLGRPMGWAPMSLRRFSRVVKFEAVVLLVALGAAALLTSVPSAREIELATQETTPQTSNTDGIFITFEVVPAGADQSRLIVAARSTLKPDPAPITGIDVGMVGPDGTTATVPLEIIDPGRYEARTAKLDPGLWVVSAEMQRDGAAAATAQFEWSVPDSIPADARPLEVATTAAAVLMLVAAAGATRFARKREEDPIQSDTPVYERTER